MAGYLTGDADGLQSVSIINMAVCSYTDAFYVLIRCSSLENVSFLFLFCNLIRCFGACMSTPAPAAGLGVGLESFLLKT
jgi:hypothetical protein